MIDRRSEAVTSLVVTVTTVSESDGAAGDALRLNKGCRPQIKGDGVGRGAASAKTRVQWVTWRNLAEWTSDVF